MRADKVGIITLPGNFNFGNRLQCFAMVKAVQQLGREAYVLERESRYSWYRNAYYSLKETLRNITGGVEMSAEQMRTPGRTAAFERFGNYLPTVVLPGEGYSSSDDFDYFIVGSDQVWNPNEIAHQEKWYFAKFARPEQRVAVAASLGIDSFANAKQADCVANGVKGFAHVSVREKRGAELLRDCAGIEADVICDPTLVLSANTWRNIADARLTPTEPYVLTYLLGGMSEEAAAVLDEVTNQGRIPVIPLSDHQQNGEPDAGPAEFIDLIDHASHVVTDSFHAAVFSAILHVPLTVVHRASGVSMFSRLEQLTKMLGIEKRIYGATGYSFDQTETYDRADKAIADERRRFMDYLETCLVI